MDNLEKSLRLNHNWVIERIHTLCQDDENIEDAYALTREFDEWLEPDAENDVLSLEFIGDYY